VIWLKFTIKIDDHADRRRRMEFYTRTRYIGAHTIRQPCCRYGSSLLQHFSVMITCTRNRLALATNWPRRPLKSTPYSSYVSIRSWLYSGLRNVTWRALYAWCYFGAIFWTKSLGQTFPLLLSCMRNGRRRREKISKPKYLANNSGKFFYWLFLGNAYYERG
jgi:hypothetical protein